MKKEWRDKWVAALRSGKYEQIRGALKVDDCFCALGVLCDILSSKVGGDWEPFDGFYSTHKFKVDGHGATGSLTKKISDEVEITVSEEAQVTHLNDTLRKSFDEIATYIEVHF